MTPSSNRALHRMRAEITYRWLRLAADERVLAAQTADAAHAADAATRPITFERWAEDMVRNPAAYLGAVVDASVVPPLWPEQEHMVTQMLACEARQHEDGGCGGVLREPAGSGKTRAVYETVARDARTRVREAMAAGTSVRRARFGPGCPTLVIVPTQLERQWETQWRKFFTPQILAVDFVSTARVADTASAVNDADIGRIYHCVDVVVTTYDTLKAAAPTRDGDAPRGLFAIEWRRLVLEEGAVLTNTGTRVYHVCQRLRARRRILVTATPLPNARASELNAILGFLGSRERLPLSIDEGVRVFGGGGGGGDLSPAAVSAITSGHVVDVDDDDDASVEDPQRDRARRLIARYMLPQATHETEMVARVIWLDFATDAERRAYEAIDAAAALEPNAALSWLTVRRKAVLSPALILSREERAALPANRRPSTRMAAAVAYIRDAVVAAGERALVFCEWVSPLHELAHHLTRAGIASTFFHGEMAASALARSVADFMSPSGPPVMLMTIRIGAIGLDGLQYVANHAILLAGYWHPSMEAQAGGRIDRPGQSRPVHFVKFVLRGTVDEGVLRVNEQKRARDRRLFTTPTERMEETAT